MNNKDLLETEELKTLINIYANAFQSGYYPKTEFENILNYISKNFTPKTVEESYRLVKVQGVLTLASYHQYSDYASLFYGTRKQCEAEKQRLEQIKGHGGDALAYGLSPLTKGREESKIICMGEAFGRARCTVDCQNCIDTDKEHEGREESEEFYCEADSVDECTRQCAECARNEKAYDSPPNSDNYRAELLTVATAAMNGMLANSISKDEGVEPYWYMQSDRVAQYALEYAKSLLSAIDKEVKSNPEAE